MNNHYQLENFNIQLSNFTNVSYYLRDITAGNIVHTYRYRSTSNPIRIGLLEIKDIQGNEYANQSKRIFYVGELETEYNTEDFEDQFNSLYGNEHVARFFIGSKQHMDKIYEEILNIVQTQSYQEKLAKDIEYITDTPIGYYQIEINDEFSIIHILHYDDEVHDYVEQCLKDKGLFQHIEYDFTSPDLFNSSCFYWDNWMISNSSEDLLIAYYKNLNSIKKKELIEHFDDNSIYKLAYTILQNYEKNKINQ